MNNPFMKKLRARSESYTPKILFADSEDDRVLGAAMTLAADEIAQPVMLGDAAAIAKRIGRAPEGIEILEPSALRDGYTRAIADELDVSRTSAAKLLERPAYLGAALLDDGAADALVAGIHEHACDVLIAYEKVIGRAPGVRAFAGISVLDTLRGPIALVDSATNPCPDAERLAEMALQAVDACAGFLDAPPHVALLTVADAAKVSAAIGSVRVRRPSLALDAEILTDTPLDADAAMTKIGATVLGGRANVLVFPDLDAADLGGKLLRTIAQANTYGAFVVGAAMPAVKLSRSATVDEILGTCLLLSKAYAPVVMA